MIIRDLFEKDINRPINGVVKIAENDEGSIYQELTEYVVTNELLKHFSTFFESYSRSFDEPTQDVGVWITGFYGSGKSHFLKMLSYLLSNKEVKGKSTVKYFEDKISDPFVYQNIVRACSAPTETVTFNIGDIGGKWKTGDMARTAILLSFARAFYDSRGFYGTNINIAALEEAIEDGGKTDEFLEAFETITGHSWTGNRRRYKRYANDICAIMQKVMGWEKSQTMLFLGKNEVLSADELTDRIVDYVNTRIEEKGQDFRLVFLVDELSQFMTSDPDLMLDMQSLIELIGVKCHGHAWIIATGQEAIDEMSKRIPGVDLSKIAARFSMRLSLSSSNAEEVIKRRVLQKNDSAEAILEAEYKKSSVILNNLFTFSNARSDYLGYAGEQEFVSSYPFVGYQFKLMPLIMKNVRTSGDAGQNFSSGERSMLSGFQQSAQAVENLQTGALVPLWHFFDSFYKFLDHDIQQTINRCAEASQDSLGLRPMDVDTLKTLYLLRKLDNHIKPTLENVAIAMIDSISVDVKEFRESVSESLSRLVSQNYVGRSGDSYHFLTNVEQEVAREIRDESIDAAAIVDVISSIVFDGIFEHRRKLKIGFNDFPVDSYVDGVLHGTSQNGMHLELITQANALLSMNIDNLNSRSSGRALVILNDEFDYFENLYQAAKIQKYYRRNPHQRDVTRQQIMQEKQREASNLRDEAARFIAESIVNARVYIDGTIEDIRAPKADKKLEMVLERLASVVYKKANYINAPINDKSELIRILKGTNQRALDGTGGGNQQAISAVETFLEVQRASNMPTSFGDIKREFQKEPYGWREIDIAGCVAQLIADKKAEVSRAGMPLDAQDSKLADYLTNKNEAEGLKVSIRERVDELLLKQVRKILHDLPNIANLPTDEDGLVGVAKEWLENVKTHCGDLLAKEYMQGKDYPGKQAVTKGRTLAEQLLEQSRSAKAFLEAIVSKKTELLDFGEDYERVLGFFPNQQRIFDEALDACELVDTDSMYLKDNAEIQDALASIRGVISDQHPWNDLMKLGGYVRTIKTQHASALASQKRELLDALTGVEGDIREFANGKRESEAVLSVLPARITPYRNQINSATTLIKLYAIKEQLYAFGDDQKALIDQIDEEANTAKSVVSPVIHTTDASGQPMTKRIDLGSDTTQQPAPTIKKLDRRSVFDYGKLTSPDEVDAYVEKVRQKLLTELDDVDAIVISNG